MASRVAMRFDIERDLAQIGAHGVVVRSSRDFPPVTVATGRSAYDDLSTSQRQPQSMPAAVEELEDSWAPVNFVVDGACRCEVDKKSTARGAETHVADVATATRPTWSANGAA